MATGLAGRYATALFGLAREGKQIDTVSASLAKVRAALAESEDFRALTASPLIGRGAATSAVLGAAEAMGLDGITRNFLGVLATNRRLGALRSEEHTSELQSLMRISYAVFCLKKKN